MYTITRFVKDPPATKCLGDQGRSYKIITVFVLGFRVFSFNSY